MIPRYSRPDMKAIWEPETRFQIWLEIEAHACDAMAELGVVPKDAAQAIWDRGTFEIDRIDEIEREEDLERVEEGRVRRLAGVPVPMTSRTLARL